MSPITDIQKLCPIIELEYGRKGIKKYDLTPWLSLPSISSISAGGEDMLPDNETVWPAMVILSENVPEASDVVLYAE